MSYLESALDWVPLLRTEIVPVTQIAAGDVIVPTEGVYTDGIITVETVVFEHIHPRVLIAGNGTFGIECEATDYIRRVLRSCLKNPPSGGLTPLEIKLESVKFRHKVLKNCEAAYGLHKALELVKELLVKQAGFCDHCCLPEGACVERCPDTEPQEGFEGSPYGAALANLSEQKLLALPVPYTPLHVTSLRDELRKRIDVGEPLGMSSEKTRYEWLMDDSMLNSV